MRVLIFSPGLERLDRGCGYGDGYGDGYGCGHGDVYGYGRGDGYGCGDGDGDVDDPSLVAVDTDR